MYVKATFKKDNEIIYEKKEETKNILQTIESIGKESISEIHNKLQKGNENYFTFSEGFTSTKEKEKR